MKKVHSLALTVLAAGALALAPQGLLAQQEITTDFSGGAAIPGGDLSDAVKLGPGFTIGLGFRVHDRVSIRAEGGADIFAGEDFSTVTEPTFEGPDLTVTRLDAGLVLHAITAEQTDGFWVDADVGAGVHILTSDRFERQILANQVTIIDVSKAYFGAKGGLTFGYRFTDQVSAFVGGDAYLTMADTEDTASYNDIPGVAPLETLWTFPVTAGLKFHFQP